MAADRGIAVVHQGGEEAVLPRDSSTLHVGSLAPEFELSTALGERFALRQASESALALVFIRGTW